MVKLRKNIKKKRAAALVVAYTLLTSLFAISGSHVSQVVQESTDIGRHINLQQAFWAAEAGVTESLYSLNTEQWSGWTGTSSTKYNSKKMNNGEFDVVLSGIGNKICALEVIGYSPTKDSANVQIKKLRVMLRKKSPFEFAAFGKYDLDVSNNSHTDSYHSSKGSYGGTNLRYNGHVGTNGSSMTLQNRGYVYGNARVAPGGEIEIIDNAGYAGDDTYDCDQYLPPVIVPTDAKNKSSDGILRITGGDTVTLSAGFYNFESIVMDGQSNLIIEEGAIVYSQDKFTVTAGAEVTVTGRSEIYIDGDIYLAGNGVANTTEVPSDLMIYGSGSSQSMYMAGTSDMHAAIYAPEASIQIDGKGDVYGAIVGGDVDMIGTGWVHYDEDLFKLDMSGLNYTVFLWKEL